MIQYHKLPRPGGYSAGGQVSEILESRVEAVLPLAGVGLDCRERPRDPTPGILDGAVEGRAVRDERDEIAIQVAAVAGRQRRESRRVLRRTAASDAP